MDKIKEWKEEEDNDTMDCMDKIDELIGGYNELIEGYNEIVKWKNRQNKISRMLMQKVYEIDFDKIMMKINDDK